MQTNINNKEIDIMKTKIDPLTFLDNMHYFPDIVKHYCIPDDITFDEIEDDVLVLFMKTCENERNNIIYNFKEMIREKYFELNPDADLNDDILMKFTLLFVKDEIVVFDNEKFFNQKEVNKYLGNVDHEFVIRLVIDSIFNTL